MLRQKRGKSMAKNIYRKTVGRTGHSNLIGIKKGLDICGSENEQKVTNEIAKFFAVTFSRSGKFKTTEYVFNFLKPGDEFREYYNLYNEVLLLFSPYKEFDGRILDFVDKTLEEFDNRLDKVCVFLVSNDDEIEKKVRLISSQNKDSKIIIPFTYHEILRRGLNREYLNEKLRSYFYSRDLYALESPLKTETYFYGRGKIVQELYDKYLLGEQSGLFGLRKTGKTSVLYALERQAINRKGCSLYIDCQNPSVYLCEWNQLLFKIIAELAQKYYPEYIVGLVEQKYIEKDAAAEFEKDIVAISQNVETRILIMFDEIEHICFKTAESEHWKSGKGYCMFWQTVRSIFQKHPECFTFLIAGVNPLCIETAYINEVENPIFDMISIKYLELFSIDNVKMMTKEIGKYMGLSFDEEIYTRLTENYGGHPFLIRHICSLINRETTNVRPCKVSKYEYDTNKKAYDRKIVHYVEMVLSVLKTWYENEYELLEILAIDGSDEFKKALVYKEKEINHLLGYGIVKEVNDNYYITIDAVTIYLENMHKMSNKVTTKEEAWQQISIRRNTLEEKLRNLMLMQMTSQYGKKNVKSKLLEVIDTGRRTSLQDKEISDLIENAFFLLDVKKVIMKNWKLFENVFIDKGKFDNFLDVINKYRVDAHAKNITEPEMLMLTIAFNWFDECMEDLFI